ncbi:MAG: protein transport protein S31 [Phylliscum demangeonii]|nr:MAG: protein transport protein S31 [Phylliscum demangeonii]
MVRLREITRTAAFAWSPGTELPWIATGTKAGAVDADFSTETALELWDLQLHNHQQNLSLDPIASVSTDSRFYDVAWARVNNERSIIAGALENGSLDLWDAEKLMSKEENAFMSRTSKHSGAIKSLQFNAFRTELLATAGARGELFISDMNNVANPFRLGSSAARADDFESVDWNKRVPHILVTGSSGGFLTVWDVKAKKESLTLNNLGRKAVSAVAWDPAQATKLATAISDDTNPLILIWDLRNSNAPERTLKGHEQGVLSLSWCQQDPEILLSCGKDNRTIAWNPRTGERYGEFPVVSNWTFQTRWNPHHPSILATAAFSGKIAVQTIQSTKSTPGQTPGVRSPTLDGEAFFNSAQTEPQTAGFSLPQAPLWLKRPTGASFAFGGKVVSFAPTGGDSNQSTVRITQFAVDGDVGTAMATFEKDLAQGDLTGICQTRIASAKSDEEKADWEVIQTLVSDSPRKRLVEFLGFSEEPRTAPDSAPKDHADEDEVLELPPVPEKGQSNGSKAAKKNRLSSFFESSGDGENFLSELSATKGARTNNPFQIYTGVESSEDERITKALLLGQFDRALDLCLREDRMSDAFMIAICGGPKAIEKAQAAYIGKQKQEPNYLRLLSSIVGKNLWDVVHNAGLSNWKEIMATLCTYATADEFPDLCEALGDRIEDEAKATDGKTVSRKDASFCYLAGSKLEKVVPIWIQETHEDEAAGVQEGNADSTFSLHAKSLQAFIEKVTVFRAATKFQDIGGDQAADSKLAPLYDKYAEYADVAAAAGSLKIAEKYLDLLPPQYATAEVAKNRVKQATRKSAAPSASKPGAGAARTGMRTQPVVPGLMAAQAPGAAPSGFPHAYMPAGSGQAPGPSATSNPGGYTPVGYQQAQAQPGAAGYGAPGQPYGGYYPGQGAGAPPRTLNASPSVPPPSRATDMSNWNDVPMINKVPVVRRNTPVMGAGASAAAFSGLQPSAFSAPPVPPYTRQQRATPPIGPPPKGPAPPRVASPSMGQSPPLASQPFERPPSAARSQYAPAVSSGSGAGLATAAIPRGASPYHPPPSTGPSSNRYAPAAVPDAPGRASHPSPAAGRPGPPLNPYAPPSTQASAPPQPPQGPPYPAAPVPAGRPPPNGAQGAAPSAAPSQQRSTASTPSAAQPKYPPGDRTHIPDAARPIFEILHADMQRVKAKAPPSFKAQVLDTEKRLERLFNHLNNESLLKPDTVESMVELATALRAREYDTAQAIQLDLHTNKVEQCGEWMVGVKRLIVMSRATP